MTLRICSVFKLSLHTQVDPCSWCMPRWQTGAGLLMEGHV